MGSFRVGVALGAALLAAVAGCSNTQTGTPTAAAGTTTPTRTTTTDTSAPTTGPTSSSASTSSVTRPRSIDLKGTTSCKILNAIPAAEFGWPGKTPTDNESFGFPGMRECIVVNSGKFTVSVTAVTTQGVAEFTHDGQGEGLSPTTIAGFPGFTFDDSNTGGCFAGVDVADGQMLYVQWRYSDTQNIPTKETLCANAVKVAAGAMKVLGAS